MLQADKSLETGIVFLSLLIYPLVLFPERPVPLRCEECGQLLLVAQQHYRVIDPPQFLKLSRTLSQLPHVRLQIFQFHWILCITDQNRQKNKRNPSDVSARYEVFYLLFMLCHRQTDRPRKVRCSPERKSLLHVFWDLTDHQRSPRRLHVPACCVVGGMDRSKHNNARGPFEELSCSSHYRDSTL